jgi:hypothetical protein
VNASGNVGARTTAANDRNAQWRFRQHNGEWWYWTPQNAWMYHRDGQWHDFDQATYTYPRNWNRGFVPAPGRNYYDRYGRPYVNRYGYGYRDYGYQDYVPGSRYGTGYRGYDDGGFYGRGYSGGRYYGGGYVDPGFRAGANVGSAIGGAIGGNEGAGIGAAIGGAIGSGR